MKYCCHCGAEIMDEAVICVHCGCSVPQTNALVPRSIPKKDDTLETVVKIMLIFGCIALGWMLIPLAWCIPITVTVFKRFQNNEPITTGLKVSVLLLVSLVAGICLLCMDD